MRHSQQLEKIPTPNDPAFVTLRGPCIVTGEMHESPRISLEALERFEKDGVYAQVAFPELSAEEREFLISGTSPKGWEILFLPEVGGEG